MNTDEMIAAGKVTSDTLVLDKCLTGRYLPLAITLVTEESFSRFDGLTGEEKALAYGHRYTGNALGCVEEGHGGIAA